MKKLTAILPLLLLIIFPFISMGFPENETESAAIESQKSGKYGNKPMAVKGKLLFEDDFKTPIEYAKEFKEVKPGWKVKTAHAQWKQSGGKVESIYESGHMPVLVYSGLFQDAVIELDFRFSAKKGNGRLAEFRLPIWS